MARSMKTSFLVLNIFFICVTVRVFFYVKDNLDSGNAHPVDAVREQSIKQQSAPKTILLWNLDDDQHSYGMASSVGKVVEEKQCKVDHGQCTVTTERLHIPQADAVIVNIDNEAEHFPVRHHLEQHFVYFSQKPPTGARTNYKNHRTHFNITMSYRHDSDVPVPLGKGRYLKAQDKKKQEYSLKHPLVQRPNSVAWIVNECHTASQRDKYVNALSQYIDVHVYGKCGNHSCDEENGCLGHIEQNYKYILVFEEDVCNDYVTEQYFMALQHELIPIVYGGCKYETISPPSAYINIHDHFSPKHLAMYLKDISSDPAAFEAFFQWKSEWEFMTRANILQQGFCDLCEMLHKGIQRRYRDIHRWSMKDQCYQDIVDEVIASIDNSSSGYIAYYYYKYRYLLYGFIFVQVGAGIWILIYNFRSDGCASTTGGIKNMNI